MEKFVFPGLIYPSHDLNCCMVVIISDTTTVLLHDVRVALVDESYHRALIRDIWQSMFHGAPENQKATKSLQYSWINEVEPSTDGREYLLPTYFLESRLVRLMILQKANRIE